MDKKKALKRYGKYSFLLVGNAIGMVGLSFFLLLTVLSGLSLVAPSEAQQTVPSGQEIETSPVIIDNMTLFRVRGIQAHPAGDRAADIEERIKQIAADHSVRIDSIKSVETDMSTDIVADGKPIMSVYDADASLEGIPRQLLARAYISKLRTSIEQYRQERSAESLVKNALFALLASVVFIVAIRILFWLFRKLDAVIEARYKARIHALRIQNLEIVQAEKIYLGLTGIEKVIRLVLIFILLYFYLNVVLSLFPWTRLLAANLLSYALAPLRTIGNGFVRYIPNLIFIFILVVVARYVLKLTQLFFAAIESETIKFAGFDKDWAKPTYKAVRLLVIVFAVVVIYPHIPGSESTAFKGVSIFLGVLFSLGSSSALSNIVAGYTMIYRRAFKVGDRIKINDVTGDVTEIRLLVTHLRTIKNEEIIVPNSTILNSQIMNYSSYARDKGLILHTTVGIGYEAPWRQVEAMLTQAAERTTGLLREPKPFVFKKSLGDFAVTYELNAYTDDPHGMAQIYSELHKNILDAFNEYGVQIMTPAYEGDPEQPKVVPKDQWFAAPARPQDKGKDND